MLAIWCLFCHKNSVSWVHFSLCPGIYWASLDFIENAKLKIKYPTEGKIEAYCFWYFYSTS